MELGPIHHRGFQGDILSGVDEGIHHDLGHRLLAGNITLDQQQTAVRVNLQSIQIRTDGTDSTLGHQNDHVTAVGADVDVICISGRCITVHQRALFVAELNGDVPSVFGFGAVQCFTSADIAEQILHFIVRFQFQRPAVFTQQGNAAVRTHQKLLLVQFKIEDHLAKGGTGFVGIHRFRNGQVDSAAVAHGAHQLVFLILACVVVSFGTALFCEVCFHPAVFAIFGIVVVARQVLGDLVRQTLQIQLLACFDGNTGIVGHGQSLVENCHALLRSKHYQSAVLVDVGELVTVEGVSDGLAIDGVDPLSFFVEGVLPQGSQMAQLGSDDLVGGVGTAIELSTEGHLIGTIQHQRHYQAALGQIEGVGDAIAAAVYLAVRGQCDLLDRDILQRSNDQHSGLLIGTYRAAGPQNEQAAGDIFCRAVAAPFHLVQVYRFPCSVAQHLAVFCFQQGIASSLLLFHQFCHKIAVVGAVAFKHVSRIKQQVVASIPDGIQACCGRHQCARCVQGSDLIVDTSLVSSRCEIDVRLHAVQQIVGGLAGGIAIRIVDIPLQHCVAGIYQHLGRIIQKRVAAAGNAQVPFTGISIGAGLEDDGVVVSVTAHLVFVLGLTGIIVVRLEGNRDVVLFVILAHDEGTIAGIMLMVLILRQHRFGGAYGLAHQGVHIFAVLGGFLQVESLAGMAVHQIVALAVDDLRRGFAQVRPDLLAVDADAVAVGILHVIYLADNPVLRLGSQFAGIFVLGNVVMLIQRAVRLLVHCLIKASVFDTAGIVLGREAGGHRLHLHIGKLQPVAVHSIRAGMIYLGSGFILVVIDSCPNKFGEAEHIHTVVLSVGGIGHAVHLDAAFHCPFHSGHPVHAGKCLIQAGRLATEVLARSHGVAKARDIYQPHSSAADGHGVVAVPDHCIAGAQEIRHRKGVAGSIPPHLTQMGTAAPLMGVSCHRIK